VSAAEVARSITPHDRIVAPAEWLNRVGDPKQVPVAMQEAVNMAATITVSINFLRCPELVSGNFTLAATKLFDQLLQMPRARPVEFHVKFCRC